MTDTELASIVSSQIHYASGWLDTERSLQRRQALEFYYGEPMGNETDGRSQVILQDVLETIEWMLPQLLKIFLASDKIVEFTPVGPEDEEAAEQATDYVNHILLRDNNGFQLIYNWFKDALLQKVGTLKIWWDNSEEQTRENLTAQTLEMIEELLGDAEVELVEQRALDGTETLEALPQEAVEAFQAGADVSIVPELFDIDIIRTQKRGRVVIEGVAPEEYIINNRAVTDADASFQGHRAKRTVTDMLEQGFDPKLVDRISVAGADSAGEFNQERTVRFNIDSSLPDFASVIDESMREAWVVEGYIKVDWDGDGLAELRQVTVGGESYETILQNEPVDDHPFVSITPIPIPHKFHGLSIADLVMDIQQIRSTIMRLLLDNMYGTNNNRWAYEQGKVDLNALLTNVPNQAVPTIGPPGDKLMPMVAPPLGNFAFPLLEYMEQQRESRTGVTRHSQGLDPDSLNKTMGGINLLQQASQQRIELIARIFAEGIKELARKILRLTINNQDRKRVLRMRGEWIDIDPRAWNANMDVNVNAGLGYASQESKAAAANQLLQVQERIIEFQGGVDGPLVDLTKLHATLEVLTESAGFKSVDQFFLDPKDQENQPQQQQEEPPDPRIEADLAKTKAEIEKMQAEMQMKAEAEKQRQTLEREKAEAQLQQEQQKAAAELGLDRQKAEAEAAQKNKVIDLDAAREERKMLLDHELKMAEIGLRKEEWAADKVDGEAKAAASNGGKMPVLNIAVGAGKKTVDVVRDAGGNITGAEVTEAGN